MTSQILVVDDEQNMQTVIRMVLEEAGHQVRVCDQGEAALALIEEHDFDVVLSDLKMPGMGGEEFVRRVRADRPDLPVIVITAFGTIQSAVASIHAGASDYLTKPFEPEALEIAVHNAVKLRDVLRENQRLRAWARSERHVEIVGESAAARRLHEEIRRIAPFKSNVLITGESGTGKELAARLVHELGPRRDRPWVAINCSAIPKDLLESELFGYVKGAFTGAGASRIGRIEQARGGTLFLDEIGDLELALQGKILRVLEEREFSPLGSNKTVIADIRLIAATNRDLKDLVRAGRFREDLYYRLDVYNLVVPTLRERIDDVMPLAQSFLAALRPEIDRPVAGFTAAAEAALRDHSWPGNVRELRNAVERALLSARGDAIDVGDLPQVLWERRGAGAPSAATSTVTPDAALDDWLERLERDAILAALSACGGVQAQAARQLGISERSLWHRVKKLKIQVSRSFR